MLAVFCIGTLYVSYLFFMYTEFLSFFHIDLHYNYVLGFWVFIYHLFHILYCLKLSGKVGFVNFDFLFIFTLVEISSLRSFFL